MRPYDFRQQLFVSGNDPARLLGEVIEPLQIMDEACNRIVNDGFPDDVVSQRLLRKSIDRRPKVGEQDRRLAFPGGGLGSFGAELREAMTAFCIALPGFWALGELALAVLG